MDEPDDAAHDAADATTRLVQAVLDAVEARLEHNRRDVAAFAAEVERRHHDVLGVVAALERRIIDLERAEQHRRTTASTVAERLDDMSTRLDALSQAAIDRWAPTPAAGMPIPFIEGDHEASDLSPISRPLLDPAHITTPVPTVSDPSIQRMTSLPLPAPVRPTLSSPTGEPDEATAPIEPAELAEPVAEPVADLADDAQHDGIDLERLSQLLTERLGHLELPPRRD